MTAPAVVIRADAGLALGTGHLMRCRTLARALAAFGAQIRFLIGAGSEPWRDLVAADGFGVDVLPALPEARCEAPWRPWPEPADAQASLALAAGADWLVVDHYGLGQAFGHAMRAVVPRVAVIDDLADRSHDCDLLVDHNLPGDAGRYSGLIPAGAHALTGPAYALIDPRFAAARRDRDGSLRRVLVFMGGTDAAGATRMALQALADPRLAGLAVTVVIGGRNPHREAIAAATAAQADWRLIVDTPDMPDLLAEADLALGAGGGAALERCSAGLPSLVVVTADNQLPGITALAAAGAARRVAGSAAALTEAMLALRADAGALRTMGAAAAALVDGHGARRVAGRMMRAVLPLTIRLGEAGDRDVLLDWRNAPAARAASLTTAPIAPQDHANWFGKALADPTLLLLMGSLGPSPVGTLRYAMKGSTATISIGLDPALTGLGLARGLLEQGEIVLRARRPDIRTLEAVVRRDNAPSHRLFRRAGFAAVSENAATVLYARTIGPA